MSKDTRVHTAVRLDREYYYTLTEIAKEVRVPLATLLRDAVAMFFSSTAETWRAKNETQYVAVRCEKYTYLYRIDQDRPTKMRSPWVTLSNLVFIYPNDILPAMLDLIKSRVTDDYFDGRYYFDCAAQSSDLADMMNVRVGGINNVE